jgi:hypothetical protein
MLGNLSEDYEMTKLIAQVTMRFALAKRLRLRGVISVNSIEFKTSPFGEVFLCPKFLRTEFGQSSPLL